MKRRDLLTFFTGAWVALGLLVWFADDQMTEPLRPLTTLCFVVLSAANFSLFFTIRNRRKQQTTVSLRHNNTELYEMVVTGGGWRDTLPLQRCLQLALDGPAAFDPESTKVVLEQLIKDAPSLCGIEVDRIVVKDY